QVEDQRGRLDAGRQPLAVERLVDGALEPEAGDGPLDELVDREVRSRGRLGLLGGRIHVVAAISSHSKGFRHRNKLLVRAETAPESIAPSATPRTSSGKVRVLPTGQARRRPVRP